MLSKKDIREIVKKIRFSYPQDILQEMSFQICDFIERLEVYKKAKNVVYYYPKRGEVSLISLMGKDFFRKKVFLPKVWLKEKKMTFHQIFSFSDLKPGPFGLLEPLKDNPMIPLEEIELIFVPGLAFDLSKGRIGYGGGFYDRVLPKIKGKKIGVAFSFQIFDSLPFEFHDCKVDLIVTEEGIINEE